MITQLPQKEELKNNGIFKSYHCINGASHSYFCCETCWNQHPNPKLHLPQFSSEDAMRNYDKYKKQYNLL